MKEFRFYKRVEVENVTDTRVTVHAVPESVHDAWLSVATEHLTQVADSESGQRNIWARCSEDGLRETWILAIRYDEYVRWFDDQYGRGRSVAEGVGSAHGVGDSATLGEDQLGTEGR